MTDGTRDGQHASKGTRIETRHIGPKVRSKWVPDTISLDRLKALLPLVEGRNIWRCAVRYEIQSIIAAKGRGYPNLDWLASRYERLLSEPVLTGAALQEQAARDQKDLEGR